MIIDCRTWKTAEQILYERRRVFVDGIEIKQVWYVDTEAGFVCSFDVLGDGKVHATREKLDPEVIAKARDTETEFWDMPLGGAISKTVRGVVELKEFEKGDNTLTNYG